MARHNREGKGLDQRGFEYQVSYQPDWLRRVKITRALPTGRRSTMILFRNPNACRKRLPGAQVRTRITCPAQGVDVEVTLRGNGEKVGGGAVRCAVTCAVPAAGEGGRLEEVTFTLEDGLPAGPGEGA